MITVGQILEWMESGKTFSCKVVSYDRNRKKGGEIKEYPEAVLVQHEEKELGSMEQIRALTKMEQQKAQLSAIKKDPGHRKWYTRNIRELQNGYPTSLIRTIHPPLIIEFNGQTVVP